MGGAARVRAGALDRPCGSGASHGLGGVPSSKRIRIEARRPRPNVRGTLVVVEEGRLPRQPRARWRSRHGCASPTSTCSGAPTSTGSTWSAHGDAASRRSNGLRRGRVAPSRPAAEPGGGSAASTQRCIARPRVADRRLPWERCLPLDNARQTGATQHSAPSRKARFPGERAEAMRPHIRPGRPAPRAHNDRPSHSPTPPSPVPLWLQVSARRSLG